MARTRSRLPPLPSATVALAASAQVPLASHLPAAQAPAALQAVQLAPATAGGAARRWAEEIYTAVAAGVAGPKEAAGSSRRPRRRPEVRPCRPGTLAHQCDSTGSPSLASGRNCSASEPGRCLSILAISNTSRRCLSPQRSSIRAYTEEEGGLDDIVAALRASQPAGPPPEPALAAEPAAAGGEAGSGAGGRKEEAAGGAARGAMASLCLRQPRTACGASARVSAARDAARAALEVLLCCSGTLRLSLHTALPCSLVDGMLDACKAGRWLHMPCTCHLPTLRTS